jgi:hypothetical protein
MSRKSIAQMSLYAAAKVMANNHAQFDSFVWYEAPEDSEVWGIYYATSDTAPIYAASNYDTMVKRLQKHIDAGFIRAEAHSTWVGPWVEGFSIKVFDKPKGKITSAFRDLYEILCELEDYPVLDEDDWSRREWEAIQEFASSEIGRLVDVDVHPDAVSQVMEWLENDRHPIELDGDGRTPWVDEVHLYRAIAALEIGDPEDDTIRLYSKTDRRYPSGTNHHYALRERYPELYEALTKVYAITWLYDIHDNKVCAFWGDRWDTSKAVEAYVKAWDRREDRIVKYLGDIWR